MRSLDRGQSGYGRDDADYGEAPSLLLLADRDEALSRGCRAAAAAGMRLVGARPVADGGKAIAARAAVDAILVDASDPAELERLMPQLASAAARGSRCLIVACAGRRGVARAIPPGSAIRIVPSRGGLDLLQALQVARAPARPCFHDVKNADSPRLQQLSAEVGRIANILASLSEDERDEEANGHGGPRIDAALVRAIIRVRRLRDHYFRSELFADPAWDMLLDLYAARLDHQRVAVSSLCIAAAVPATTALRWIKSLTDQRLFVRVADPQDGRRVFIELSDEAAAGLEAYLRAAQRISPLIV